MNLYVDICSDLRKETASFHFFHRDICKYIILIYYTITISKVMILFSCQAFGERVFGKWKLVISLGVAFSAFGSGLCNVFAASR